MVDVRDHCLILLNSAFQDHHMRLELAMSELCIVFVIVNLCEIGRQIFVSSKTLNYPLAGCIGRPARVPRKTSGTAIA